MTITPYKCDLAWNKIEPLRSAVLYKELLSFCRRLTRSKEEAEDLAHDAWVRALRRPEGGENHPQPMAYLKRIAKNRWTDLVRRQCHYEQNVAPLMMSGFIPTSQEPTDAPHSVEAAVRLLVRTLSPVQRTIFLLRDCIGLTAPETAALLSTTEGAVKAALHRARGALTKSIRMTEEAPWEESNVTEHHEEAILVLAYCRALQVEDVSLIARLMNHPQPDMAVLLSQAAIYAHRVRRSVVPQSRLAA